MFVDIIKILEELLAEIVYMVQVLGDRGYPVQPKGSLRNRASHHDPSYDLVINEKGRQKSRHIGGDGSPEVISFRTQAYNWTLYKTLVHDKPIVEKMLKIARAYFKKFDPQSIDAQLKPVYVDHTGLVNKNPAFMSDADWKKTRYRHSNRPVQPGEAYVTCDGTSVRSKGELIIYNTLAFLEVPFRYEEVIPLIDENGRRVNRCPDFVILRPDGREVILEYLGMLNDEKYATDNFDKFMLYWRNGYVLNDTLFYVMDDVNGTLNAQVVTDLIRHNIMWAA